MKTAHTKNGKKREWCTNRRERYYKKVAFYQVVQTASVTDTQEPDAQEPDTQEPDAQENVLQQLTVHISQLQTHILQTSGTKSAGNEFTLEKLQKAFINAIPLIMDARNKDSVKNTGREELDGVKEPLEAGDMGEVQDVSTAGIPDCTSVTAPAQVVPVSGVSDCKQEVASTLSTSSSLKKTQVFPIRRSPRHLSKLEKLYLLGSVPLRRSPRHKSNTIPIKINTNKKSAVKHISLKSSTSKSRTTKIPTKSPSIKISKKSPSTEIPTESPCIKVSKKSPSTESPSTETPTKSPSIKISKKSPSTEIPTKSLAIKTCTKSHATESLSKSPTIKSPPKSPISNNKSSQITLVPATPISTGKTKEEVAKLTDISNVPEQSPKTKTTPNILRSPRGRKSPENVKDKSVTSPCSTLMQGTLCKQPDAVIITISVENATCTQQRDEVNSIFETPPSTEVAANTESTNTNMEVCWSEPREVSGVKPLEVGDSKPMEVNESKSLEISDSNPTEVQESKPNAALDLTTKDEELVIEPVEGNGLKETEKVDLEPGEINEVESMELCESELKKEVVSISPRFKQSRKSVVFKRKSPLKILILKPPCKPALEDKKVENKEEETVEPPSSPIAAPAAQLEDHAHKNNKFILPRPDVVLSPATIVTIPMPTLRVKLERLPLPIQPKLSKKELEEKERAKNRPAVNAMRKIFKSKRKISKFNTSNIFNQRPRVTTDYTTFSWGRNKIKSKPQQPSVKVEDAVTLEVSEKTPDAAIAFVFDEDEDCKTILNAALQLEYENLWQGNELEEQLEKHWLDHCCFNCETDPVVGTLDYDLVEDETSPTYKALVYDFDEQEYTSETSPLLRNSLIDADKPSPLLSQSKTPSEDKSLETIFNEDLTEPSQAEHQVFIDVLEPTVEEQEEFNLEICEHHLDLPDM